MGREQRRMERRDSLGLVTEDEEFTRDDGRKFGLSVGVAFLLLGVLLWWRGHVEFMYAVATIGALLALSGIVLPGRLEPIYAAWMAMAEKISRVTTPIVLGIVYLLVLAPSGLVLRLFGKNPLDQDGGREGTYWSRREERSRTDMHRQF